MKELLLDARTIIENPKLLGLNSPDYKLTTTEDVIQEISESGSKINISYTDRLQLIEKAVFYKNLEVVTTTDYGIDLIARSITSLRLSSVEKGLLAYILNKKQNGETVYLITKHKLLKKYATNYKIDLFPLAKLYEILEDLPKETAEPDILSQIEEYSKNENQRIFIGLISGALLSVLAVLSYMYINTILASTNVWGTIFLTIFLSFALYIIREKWRLPYGFLEFSVGVFSVFILFYPSRFNFNAIPFDSSFFIKIIGGLYIMVRGIDNIMIAINDTRMGLLIRKFFALDK